MSTIEQKEGEEEGVGSVSGSVGGVGSGNGRRNSQKGHMGEKRNDVTPGGERCGSLSLGGHWSKRRLVGVVYRAETKRGGRVEKFDPERGFLQARHKKRRGGNGSASSGPG